MGGAEQRMIITSDKDFGDLIFHSGQDHQGILLFRLRDESATNQVRTLTSVLDQYAERLLGHFVVIRESGVRIRAKTRPF